MHIVYILCRILVTADPGQEYRRLCSGCQLLCKLHHQAVWNYYGGQAFHRVKNQFVVTAVNQPPY